MASTNQTTNLFLSQFLGVDKPDWKSDYNEDMRKIDKGAMTKATYDPAGTGSIISTYTHTKTGTTHNLVGTGNTFTFTATENNTQGDVWMVNGVTITPENQNGQPIGTGAVKIGDIVMCLRTNSALRMICRKVHYLLWSGTVSSGGVFGAPLVQYFEEVALIRSASSSSFHCTKRTGGVGSVRSFSAVPLSDSHIVLQAVEFKVVDTTVTVGYATSMSAISGTVPTITSIGTCDQFWGI